MRKRANLFKYLKCKKMAERECTPERAENDCATCPFIPECNYYTENDLPWLVDLYYEIDFKTYEIKEKIADWIAKHKKAYYVCEVCGKIEAPYFDSSPHAINYGYGWHKFKGSNRWVCHNCADHGYSSEYFSTWKEWQEFVKEENIKILDLIKEKDPEFYRKSGMGWIKR